MDYLISILVTDSSLVTDTNSIIAKFSGRYCHLSGGAGPAGLIGVSNKAKGLLTVYQYQGQL